MASAYQIVIKESIFCFVQKDVFKKIRLESIDQSKIMEDSKMDSQTCFFA